MPRRKRPLGRRGSHPRLAQGARINTERIISEFRADADSEQGVNAGQKQGHRLVRDTRQR